MFAFGVIKHFDVIEYVLPSFKSGLIGFASDTFTLQQIEEPLSDRAIMTVSSPALANTVMSLEVRIYGTDTVRFNTWRDNLAVFSILPTPRMLERVW